MIEDELFATKNSLEFGKSARINKKDWVSFDFGAVLSIF
jgi:hypothetical protein